MAVDPEKMRWSFVGLYSLAIFLTLSLNLVIIIAVSKGRLYKYNVINIYLMSLVTSRMCIAVLVIPAYMTGLFNANYLGVKLCKVCHFFALSSSATSVFSTTAIAIIKFREIVIHKGIIQITSKQAIRDVIIIWLFGHVYGIRAPFFNSLFNGMCTITPDYVDLSNYLVFMDFAVLFVGPLCIVAYCYVRVIRYLSAESKRRVLEATSQLGIVNKAVEDEPNGQIAPEKQSNGLSHDVSTHNGHGHTNGLDNDVSSNGTSSSKVDLQEKTTELTPEMQHVEDERQKRQSISMIMAVISLFFICSIMPYVPKMYSFWAEKMFPYFKPFMLSTFVVNFFNPWLNAMVIIGFRPDIRRVIRILCCKSKKDEHLTMDQMLNRHGLITSRDIVLRTD